MMNLAQNTRAVRRILHAFTLLETIIALAVLGVGSIIVYETYRDLMLLDGKNIALNETDTNIQWAYYRMLIDLESAGKFVSAANYANNTFTNVANGTWGNAILFMNVCPITCYVEPDDGSGYTVTNPPPPTTTTYLQASDQTISFSYNSSLYNASCIPSDAMLFPTYPEITSTNTSGSTIGNEPGIAFTSINTATPGTVSIHLANPIGAQTFLYCNRAYFMEEAAFAVTTSSVDGHKTLLYFPDANQPSNYVTICQKMDGSNQTQPGDSTIPTGGTAGNFCIQSGTSAVQVLLPIRSLEFLNVMSRAGGSVSRNNTWVNVNCQFHQRSSL